MKEKKKKISLTTQIFAALILGCLCGVLMHYVVPSGYVKDTVFVNGIFYVVGNGFIRLMKMLVVPLVFCSLVCGSMAMGDTKSLGKIGVKALLFYLVTTALAISVALGACNPMLWCISDFDEGIDWSESNKVPEEICSGYELCIFNSNIKRNDSVVY